MIQGRDRSDNEIARCRYGTEFSHGLLELRKRLTGLSAGSDQAPNAHSSASGGFFRAKSYNPSTVSAGV